MVHLGCADAAGPISLELLDELSGDRVDLAAPCGGPDELGSTVGGVRHPFHVAVLFEVVDKLGHRLFRDLSPLSQDADASSGLVEELEDVAVRSPDLGVAALREPLVQQLGANPERLP